MHCSTVLTLHLLDLMHTAFMFASLLPFCYSEVIYCDLEYECQSLTLSEGNSIHCRGYHSCDSASILTGVIAQCRSGYACYGASIDLWATSSRAMNCKGGFSCAYVTSVESDNLNDELYCYGDKSCFGISSIESGYIIECSGFRSCMNSQIFLTNDAYFDGYLSGQNTDIISRGDITVHFEAPGAGYKATITCNNGHTCTINCYTDACDELEWGGIGAITISCADGAHKSDACPNGKDISSKYLTDLPRFEENGINEYNVNPCDDSSTTRCSDYRECYYWDNVTNIHGAVCCSGEESCDHAQVNTINATDVSIANNKTAIVCDGYKACEYGSLVAKNGGNIYLSGELAGRSADITTENEYDIYCTAKESCFDAEINKAGNVYCIGSLACSIVEYISNIANNIYLYGYKVGQKGYINNIGGNVYGLGYQALSQTEINNVNGSVVALGYQVLINTTINNVEKIYCESGHCLENGVITNVSKIEANGTNCLKGTIMKSSDGFQFSNDGVFTLEIYGVNNDEFTVKCTNSDTCFIGCYTNDACDGMLLYCHFGTCYIDCGDTNGNTCPSVINGTFLAWETENPTTYPTRYPSFYPSIEPSNYPTAIPSDNPNKTTITPPKRNSNR